MEKSKLYIHRTLEDLPQDYMATVHDYLNAVIANINQRNDIEAMEDKLEKTRGDVFDLIHRVDELESIISKGERTT